MANLNAPKGLIPVCYRNGAPYNGAANPYFVPASYATALFTGDPVIVVTASSDANGIPVVNRASGAAGGASDTPLITGVMVGLGFAGTPPIPVTRDFPVFRQASVAQYILVADDPNLLFEAQEDASMGSNAPGRNVTLTAGAGSTVTGYSGFQLASASLATTNTFPVRVLRGVQRSDNNVTLANAKWLCEIIALHHTQLSSTGI